MEIPISANNTGPLYGDQLLKINNDNFNRIENILKIDKGTSIYSNIKIIQNIELYNNK